MAYFNRNNQGYQQRDNSSNNQGWIPNNQEIKRGETAPTEKGKREKVVAGNNQQNTQLMHISAVAAASGFQLSNTTNLKEAIGKFKSSPYYSSVVNQHNQKKQQQQHHNQQQNLHQGNVDYSKMSKKEHIQQISRIYQNNPTNILHQVQHNSSHIQSGAGTTTNKKALPNNQGLDPYSSNNIPAQRYSFKLPQRPSTSHDQQSVQRKQYQAQGTTQYRNTQMSITNTDGFGLKKPLTPSTGTRVATAGQRGSKLLNTSGNSLLNTSLNNGGGNSQQKVQQQHLNVLHPLQVRNTSAGVGVNNSKRRETFSINNNNNNHNNSFKQEMSSEINRNKDFGDLSPKYNTQQGDNKQPKQKDPKAAGEQYPQYNSQVKAHHADFKKDTSQSVKQNFFTHENFYSQGQSQVNNKYESNKLRESLNKSNQGGNNTCLNESFSNTNAHNTSQNIKQQQQKQLLKLTLPQSTITHNKQKLQMQDDNSDENTPRIIVTGNQECYQIKYLIQTSLKYIYKIIEQSHKIQYIDNSFTKCGEEEDETTTDHKQHRAKQKMRSIQHEYAPNSNNGEKQRISHNHDDEGDDEHEDDQEEEDEEYQNYYQQSEDEEGDEYRKQYAVPYDEDDEEEEDYDDEEEEEEQQDEDEEGHQQFHHGEEEEQHYQYYQNQQKQNHQHKPDSSDDNQLQNFIQDVDDEFQQKNNDDEDPEEEEDQFGEQNIQRYMREKMQNQKDQKASSKPFSTRPMTTEGGKRKRGIETPVQSSKQGENKEGRDTINTSFQQSQKQDPFDCASSSSQVNRRPSQKENFNACEDLQNLSSNDDQFGQEFRIDFDTQQFERPPERGKQYIGNRGPVKVDHDLMKEDSLFKENQGTSKRPPSRHRIPNRAAGLGIPAQELQEIPIKNMYDKDEADDINEQNRKFFDGQKLQIEKIKQSQDYEDTFMNFDFKNFGENQQSRKNSSRQPVIQSKGMYGDRPQSGNVKMRALNKRESFDDGVNLHLPDKSNYNNVQNLKLPNHPVSAKQPKKNTSINQKENDQQWDDFDDILNDKSGHKSFVRRLEGSDIIIKHNVSSTMNSKISNSTSLSVKVPFETSLGQDFLSLFANNFNDH